MNADFSVVGKRIPRPDAADMTTGAAKYIGDIKLPGMLVGKVLRSPFPHANILKIDKSKAEGLEGIKAIISFEDVPKRRFNTALVDLKMPPNMAKGVIQDQFVLTDKSRYVGDAVAAVAAVDDRVAQHSLELIKVEYEVLEPVIDPLEAIKPAAPKIHEFTEKNVAQHFPYFFANGSVEKGFQDADFIVEETFFTSKQKHCQLELDGAIAYFDAEGRLTVWSQCQAPHLAKRKIAEIFGIPEGKVRLIAPAIGGGFGGRSNFNAELICVALAEKSGKPVRLQYSREEDFHSHHSRQPFIQKGKIGVKKDGTITALETHIITNGGAYFEASGGTTAVNLNQFMAVYKCANTKGAADIVYTNTPISGGMRGFGNPQAMFCLEQLVDMACEKIEMDPMKFRLKNHKREGDPSWFPKLPISSCALQDCITLGAERIGWYRRKNRLEDLIRAKGIGMAVMSHPSDVYPVYCGHSSAMIKMNGDGSINLIVHPTEIGQGTLVAMSQIAAEVLGIPFEQVFIVTGDTDVTLFEMGTYSSRNTYTTGKAVHNAALEVRKQLLERAAKILEISPTDLDIRDGLIFGKSEPNGSISIAEIVKDAISNFQGECSNIVGKCSYETTGVSPSFQAGFAEVEVDIETGEIEVQRIVVAHDIGKAINPMCAEGQLEGAVVQGLGYSLMEDFIINKKTGKVKTDNFTSYKIPSSMDISKIEVILIEKGDPLGPFGAKSVAEPGLVTIGPAIANAIYDAIKVRITDLPITPEKILRALKKKESSKQGS